MGFTIHEAGLEDALAIAKIMFDDDDRSEFATLQLGTAQPDNAIGTFSARIKSRMEKGECVYVVAKDDESGQIVSSSQWMLPKDEPRMTKEERETKNRSETESFRSIIPEGMNAPLIMDFHEKIMKLREDAIQGRKHYLLANLGTFPHYRRKGAASALIHWAFSRADREGVLVYLDTQEDGMARAMYERLGFVYVGEMKIDLKQYGGTTEHTHIAMIRGTEMAS